MKKNDLRNLQDIHAPEELKQRTLAAAREVRGGEMQKAPQRPRRFGTAKRILAVACAFGVILGGSALVQGRGGDSAPAASGGAALMAKTFGLVAYAAETGEVIQPFDGKIVFDSGSGCNDLEKGFFTGCLFRVTGDGIRTVSASIDRGNIYRTKTVEGQGDDWVRALHQGTAPEIDGADEVFIWGMHDGETNYADLCWKLDNGFDDAYDPDASYGFWLPAYESGPDADLTQEWENSVARLEGAALSVTVTFDDGTSQTRTLKLHTGKLKVEYPEDGSGAVLTGELAGDNESYLYGVYADLES